MVRPHLGKVREERGADGHCDEEWVLLRGMSGAGEVD